MATDQVTVKTENGDTTMNLGRKAVISTVGYGVEVPTNRYELYDTQDLASEMTFFGPNPTGDRTQSNYDTSPPNAAEDTIISGLGITFDRAILETDAANSVSATAILNAVAGGIVQVIRQDTQAVLLEAPIGRFLDLDPEPFGTGVAVSQSGRLVRLSEVVHVPKGLAYRVKVRLASGAALPTDANWAASDLTKPALKVTAEHRGNSGR